MIICNPLLNTSRLRNLKGIIFDCDGVLFDSREVNVRFYNQVRAYFELEPMSEDEGEFVHMHSVQDSLKHILPEKFLSRLIEIREQVDYKELIPFMRMEEGLHRVLEFLRQKRIMMAINTNRTTTMGLLLQRFDLDDYFWPVVTAAKVSRPKPHPESIFKILDLWSVQRNEVAFIGDSRVDQETAMASGVPFWAYKNEYLHGEMYIPDFMTLKEFLAGNI